MEPKEVKQLLATDQNGKPFPTIENFLIIMRNDDAFSRIRYNSMREQPEKFFSNSDIQGWTDADDSSMRYHIESNYNLFSRGKCADAFNVYLKERSYSPIQELIKSLKWDGKKRCEEFFIKWALAEDDKEGYSRECGRLFFAQGIARAFTPGSKADHVVTLIGNQGAGKSTLTQWLAMGERYHVELKSIKGDESEKKLQGAWIIELAELIATQNADTVEAVKQFISAQADTFRDSYGRRAINHPRTCVFIGTTNKETFLSDPTGNRRWFPLKANFNGTFLYAHEKECKEYIRQCWAEMYHYFLKHDSKASTAPQAALKDTILKHQIDAEEDDPEIGIIEDYLTGKEKTCCAEIWEHALRNRLKDMKRNSSNDIASKLLKIGCVRGKTDRFKEYGQQKSFIVPDRIRNPSR